MLLLYNMENFLITFVASILIWLMFLGLILLWVIDGRIKKEIVVHAVISAVVAWVASLILKDIFQTTRPYIVEGVKSVVLLSGTVQNWAFPSSHLASSFALSVTIWFHNRKIGILYVIASIFIGVARVMARVHYPIDILGGAVVGTLVAVLVEKVHFKIKK